MIDTPTRLVNESNEFLEKQFAKKRKNNHSNIPLAFNDNTSINTVGNDSSLENTLKAAGTTLSSFERKKKQKLKDEFLKIVNEPPK